MIKAVFFHRLLAVIAAASALVMPAFAFSATAQKRIALTFDDAPTRDSALMTGADRTAKLIAALHSADVEQAVFFVTTNHINDDLTSMRVAAYAAAGHIIANHSHSHDWLHRTEPAKYLADIDRAEIALAGFDNRRSWFRFPYLDEGRDEMRRDAVREGLAERGLSNGYVTVDNYDWYLNHLAREAKASGQCLNMDALKTLYVETMLDAVRFYEGVAGAFLDRQPAHVLLLHENDLAAMFVDDLVNALRAEGWAIITADEAYEDPIASIEPDTLFNGQGRIAAIARAKGASPRDLVSGREDEKVLDALFDERGIAEC